MLDFLEIVWRPIIEIMIIASIYYTIFLFIRGTRAAQVASGVLIFVGFYGVAKLIRLQTLQYILSNIFGVAIIGFIVIFHPELRHGLANLGRRKLFKNPSSREKVVENIVSAVTGLASRQIGALIAIEQKIGLGDYIDTGIPINSEPSTELIQTIFIPNTPLHDGGVILTKNIIRAAGCIFPLSNRPLTIRTLGTRHRAAIGLSEETDAFIIVVSEETGDISVARRGRLMHRISEPRLTELLTEVLIPRKKTAMLSLRKQ